MLYLFLIIVIAVLGYYLYNFNKNKKSEDEKKIPNSEPKTHSILNVGVGGILKIENWDENGEDVDLEVVGRHTYLEGDSTWFELECETGVKKVWIEVEDDDELFIYGTYAKFNFRDIAIDEETLYQIEKKDKGKFEHDGITFKYEDCGDAVFYKNGDELAAQTFKYWEFEDKSEKWVLSFEKWKDNSFDIYLNQRIMPNQLTIYRENDLT
jgi:hypothetical protein